MNDNKRDIGYYWIKYNNTDTFEIAYYGGGFWSLTGNDIPCNTKDIYFIGRKLREPKE